MRRLAALVAAAVIVVGASAAAANAEMTAKADGPMIAVVCFDSDAMRGAWHWSCCGRRWAAGYGIAEMVGTELERRLRGRSSQVVDSDSLHQLLIEERLHRNDEISIATAARIGGELDADLAVLGQTRVFEAFRIARFLRGGDWAQARVVLHARIIDVRSGVVVHEESATAYQVRAVPPWDIGNRPRTDIGSSRFRYTLLGRTTSDAARALADRLRGGVGTLTASGAWQSWQGPVVVGVGGGSGTINRGADDGVAAGDLLRVVRRNGDGQSSIDLGTLTIRDVSASLATGRIDRPEDAPRPRPGDLATVLED